MTTLYLAGPMTGLPKFNFPSFVAATKELRKTGYTIITPVESDSPEVQEAAWLSETGDHADLPRGGAGSDPLVTALKNVEDISKCAGVALLPSWYKSAGTRMEVETAHRFGIPVAPFMLWILAGEVLV